MVARDEKSRHDVAVVGAGLIGCAVARALALEGARVVLLERDRPGVGASGAGAGMLAPQAESDPASPLLDLALASRAIYRDWVREIRAASGIDPDYREEGLVFLGAPGGHGAKDLEQRLAWQRERGLSVEPLDRRRLEEFFPALSSEFHAALFFPDDHLVDPLRLTRAVAAAAQAAGVTLLCGWPVTALEEGGGRVRGVRSGERVVDADLVVLAAGCWTGAFAARHPGVPEAEPIRGQMIALEPAMLPGRKTLFGPQVYLVPRSSGRLLVGSTMEHAGFDARPTLAGVSSLLSGACQMVPDLATAAFAGAWAGLRPGSPDGLPTIGSCSESGLMVATGHLRNGILLAPITAACMADLYAGRPPRADLCAFSPARHVTRQGSGHPVRDRA